MSELLIIPLISLATLIVCVVLLWLWSVKLDNASIIDIFWGPACAIPAWVAWMLADGYPPRQLLLLTLVSLWAARLAIYLGIRNIGHGEDPRYTEMRSNAKPGTNPHMFTLKKVFLLQGVVAWLISFPVQIGQIYNTPERLGILALLGTIIFFIGFMFEALGDLQLRNFKKDPNNKGRLMTTGLWSWTRHPNYFGNACLWFGLAIIALENPIGLIAIYSPFLMLFFLVKVTGKANNEKGMRDRYPEYEDYVARTSGFFPRPPKSTN